MPGRLMRASSACTRGASTYSKRKPGSAPLRASSASMASRWLARVSTQT